MKRKKVERVEVTCLMNSDVLIIKGMVEDSIGFQGGFSVHLIQLRGLFHF